jgi:hypothetical protein
MVANRHVEAMRLSCGKCMSRWCRYSSMVLSLVTAIASAFIWSAGAQVPDPCDSNVRRPIAGGLGYALREPDVRCEGMYQSPVGARPLELVSLLIGSLVFNAARDRLLIVSAPSSSGVSASLHVRAVQLPLRVHPGSLDS